MKFILGKKLAMTQIFEADGNVIPVTAVLAVPNVIVQIKAEDKNGYNAVQVGFEPAKKLKKPQSGHLKDLESVKHLREFRVEADDLSKMKRGDKISVETFEAGDEVRATGISKGRGFQGVVKRHGFKGSLVTHGHKDQLRMPGTIGATDPGRVFKGVRMAGHMGDAQVTVTGLKIAAVDVSKNILYIKGAVPGARNGLILIAGEGELKLTAPEAEAEPITEEAKTEAPVQEAVLAEAEIKTEETKTEETVSAVIGEETK